MNLPVILTVDDDPQVLAALRRDLKSRYRENYRVLAANSGEAALDVIKELKTRGDTLALLISDQRMPTMLGVDLLARCREIYPMAGRVLLTAYSDVKAAIRGINDARLDQGQNRVCILAYLDGNDVGRRQACSPVANPSDRVLNTDAGVNHHHHPWILRGIVERCATSARCSGRGGRRARP